MKFSPVANSLKLIGGKWKIMILDNLLSKSMRFGRLKRSLNGITSQMLSKQLKQMEIDKHKIILQLENIELEKQIEREELIYKNRHNTNNSNENCTSNNESNENYINNNVPVLKC